MTSSPFTMLMPIYHGDNIAFVRDAYRSATTDQTLPPTYVVIVVDGPVSNDLSQWVEEVSEEPGVTVIRLPQQNGLANALNVGLKQVTTPLVARADADDISLPQRFAIQIPMLESGLDVVGSAIAEFDDDPDRVQAIRTVYTTQEAIAEHARLACPFYHPSVAFRREAVLRNGGYPSLPHMEDYLLWARMIMHGAKLGNSPEVLVHYRVGSGAYARRGGAEMARSEARLQRQFLAMHFVTRWQYMRNRIVRGGLYRLMPVVPRQFVYRLWMRLLRRGGQGLHNLAE